MDKSKQQVFATANGKISKLYLWTYRAVAGWIIIAMVIQSYQLIKIFA